MIEDIDEVQAEFNKGLERVLAKSAKEAYEFTGIEKNELDYLVDEVFEIKSETGRRELEIIDGFNVSYKAKMWIIQQVVEYRMQRMQEIEETLDYNDIDTETWLELLKEFNLLMSS